MQDEHEALKLSSKVKIRNAGRVKSLDRYAFSVSNKSGNSEIDLFFLKCPVSGKYSLYKHCARSSPKVFVEMFPTELVELSAFIGVLKNMLPSSAFKSLIIQKPVKEKKAKKPKKVKDES